MAPRTNFFWLQDLVVVPSSPTISKKYDKRPQKIYREETKRVHFMKSWGPQEISEDVHEVPALEDLSPEEKQDLWYTKKDLQQMDEALRLDLMRSSLRHHQTDLGDNPLRGLEWKTLDGIHQRNQNRKKGLKAVLEAQSRQHVSHHANDIEEALIAKSYQEATSHCQDSARNIAIQDEQIASQVREEEQQAAEDLEASQS